MKVYNKDDFKIQEDSFDFVQNEKRIADVKLETKPTTFAKDAFKRFCKNKSSVVAAFIIGILLLCSFFVPVFNTHDIKSVHTDEVKLPAKLFNAGTGFWDGTKEYHDQPYDAEMEAPAGFKKEAVRSMTIDDVSYVDGSPDSYATGGYFYLVNDISLTESDDFEINSNLKSLYNYKAFPITADGNYKLTVEMGNVDNIENNKLGEYQIRIQYGISGNNYLLAKAWSNDYSTYTINLSDVLKENDIDVIDSAKIRIDVKGRINTKTYALIKSVAIESDGADESTKDLLREISFDDANAICLITRDEETNMFPNTYWQSTALKEVYHAEKYTVSFVYDEYVAVYGTRNMPVGGSRINEYIANGWMDYDFSIGPESFKVLNAEKCPILKVYSQSRDLEYGVYTVNADVTFYKYLGYKKMPKYIVGTDASGRDMFKRAFNCLKTSLLIAIISSAICLFIGLVWGSISGYFGGSVDLVMERFCEIISGVPWIVVMTLTILLLGNNIVTFALALCLTGWIGIAGRTRTQFYRFKGREYVLASRTLGASDKRLIFRHILPNALGTIVTSSVLMIPSVIFSEATISYLGLGLDGVDSFGVLLAENQSTGNLMDYPWLIVFPAIIISLLMISFNLFGNGLRDALNPSLKGSE